MNEIASLLVIDDIVFDDSKEDLIKIIKRQINTFNQAKINNIIIILNNKNSFLEKELIKHGLTFINNDNNPYKVGLNYLMSFNKVFIVKLSYPYFNSTTIIKMLEYDNCIRVQHDNKIGYPIMLNKKIIYEFNNYNDNFGKFLTTIHPDIIDVDDNGILIKYQEGNYKEIISQNNLNNIYTKFRLVYAKEKVFFGPGIAQLLTLINVSHSVKDATKQMSISYSKGWKMIKNIESELNYKVVIRHQGGKDGGKAMLSEKGIILLENYLQFEKECHEFILEKSKFFLKDF